MAGERCKSRAQAVKFTHEGSITVDAHIGADGAQPNSLAATWPSAALMEKDRHFHYRYQLRKQVLSISRKFEMTYGSMTSRAMNRYQYTQIAGRFQSREHVYAVAEVP